MVKGVQDGRTITGDNSHIIPFQRERRIRKATCQILTEFTLGVKEEGKEGRRFLFYILPYRLNFLH